MVTTDIIYRPWLETDALSIAHGYRQIIYRPWLQQTDTLMQVHQNGVFFFFF
jgi:hypothetical protein